MKTPAQPKGAGLAHGRGLVSRAVPRLDEREREILHALAAGMSQPEIAENRHLGLRTVEGVLADLREKLQAPTLFALGARAMELGLLSAEPR
jgi:DNA-binding NarL/FixJ family response regulator